MSESPVPKRKSSGKFWLSVPVDGGGSEPDEHFDTFRKAKSRLRRIKFDDLDTPPDERQKIWISGPVQEAILRAIRKRRETRYRIAKGAGLGAKVLPRFIDEGADIQLSTIEALCEYLGLELRPKE